MFRRLKATALATCFVATAAHAQSFTIEGTAGTKLTATPIATFDQPWAMTFLPDGTMLVTTKPGDLFHVTLDGKRTKVEGVPTPAVGGQGGLGDVVPHPDFAQNRRVYISMVESLDNGATRGAIVFSAVLTAAPTPSLTDLKNIWTQQPKLPGRGHFSHRIAFGPKGGPHEGKIFITSGDRQKQTPAQAWDMALGKVIRLNEDGTVPADNPWQDKGALAKTFWSTGHRNPLGIDFDAAGELWTNEMGPKHGDELNKIVPGDNYGWPVVSNGDNYNGTPIPDHATRPEFNAPEASWVPSIAPSGLVIYKGDEFTDWQGDALIGGLVSQALIRVDIKPDNTAQEAERYRWGKRIREVEEGPDGALYVLEDRGGARLLKLQKAD
ncbi:MAG: PQQ-dependent sugar dehydrogenase [Pseudomonadota bacterium]